MGNISKIRIVFYTHISGRNLKVGCNLTCICFRITMTQNCWLFILARSWVPSGNNAYNFFCMVLLFLLF